MVMQLSAKKAAIDTVQEEYTALVLNDPVSSFLHFAATDSNSYLIVA